MTKPEAIAQWLSVAAEAASMGLTAAAQMYRNTARSIEIEIETGKKVCACCFKAIGQGPLHR